MSGYNSDLLAWSHHQAGLLRRMGAGERVNDAVDWEKIAEEIESLGKSDQRELSSRIQTILVHLIKPLVSPARQPRAGWQRMAVEQRPQIARLLKDSPSLRRLVPAAIREELDGARTLALLDLAQFEEPLLADAAALDFSGDQVLGPWLPE